MTIDRIGTDGIEAGAVAPSDLSTGAPSWDSSGNLSFDSGYGSTAVAYGCRAWVNFNGTAAGTFAGGVSTVTRVAGSTTATVTTTTAHGLITGNQVYALTGVVAGTYTITYISATSFSFTTVATTALSAVSITFAVNSIRASGNVSSVADNGAGNYTVNFTTTMPDANYACPTGGRYDSTYRGFSSVQSQTTTSVTIYCHALIQSGSLYYPYINSLADHDIVTLAVSR